jgi:hypothetical protein
MRLFDYSICLVHSQRHLKFRKRSGLVVVLCRVGALMVHHLIIDLKAQRWLSLDNWAVVEGLSFHHLVQGRE